MSREVRLLVQSWLPQRKAAEMGQQLLSVLSASFIFVYRSGSYHTGNSLGGGGPWFCISCTSCLWLSLGDVCSMHTVTDQPVPSLKSYS